MKKNYTKPMIMFESFAVSVSIATVGCDKSPAVPSMRDICGIEGSFPDQIFFTYGADGSNCTDNGTGVEQDHDGFCYHNPSDSTNYFNS